MADKDVKVDVTVNDNTGPGLAKVRRGFDDLDKRRTKSNKSAVSDAEKTAEGVVGLLESVSTKAAGFLDDKLGGVLKGLPPQVQAGITAGIAAGAAAGAPILVETLSTALSLAAGGSFLAAGVILAAKDPAVQAAYSGLGKNILARLSQSVAPFAGQLLAIANDVDDRFTALAPGLDRTFATIAPEVRDIADGLLQAASNALPGIEAAARTSLPLFHDLATATERWGTEIGQLFQDVAHSGPGMQLLFQFLLSSVDATIIALDALVKNVGPAFNALANLTNLLGITHIDTKQFDDLGKGVSTAGQQAEVASHGFADLGGAISDVAGRQSEFLTKASQVLESQLNMDQTNLHVAESLTGVTQALKDNGKTIDASTAKGQANREAVLGAVSANIQNYESLLKVTGNSQAAAQAYDLGTAALERNLQKAGLNKSQIDSLIGTYRNVPTIVDTDLAVNGLTAAINSLADLIRQLNGINGKNFKATVTTTYKTVGHPLTGEGGTVPLAPGSAFSALDGWQRRADELSVGMAGGSTTGSVQRTGGPSEISLTSRLVLDGRVIDERVERIVDNKLDRASRRQKVGLR